ncbi:hypothetical protein LWI29_014345 [Acer saccharum]|uniref:Uncharacterized protein n=1 Tax=Acer saccharum TaxID=4024 RepID=A0AA39VFX3_ACESA|nr:hypothetical protein LWI29_014345 [Acer saccharum]
MLRLNVWLRSESPPKRFNHRNDSLGRRMWGYQGGKNHGNMGQGNWRPRGDWRRTDQEGPEYPAGDRSRTVKKLTGQVGGVLSIEPITTSRGKGKLINASGEKAVSGASSAGSELILDRAKGQKPSTEASIYGGHDHHAETLMEVDNSAKTIGSGPATGPSSPNRVLQPNYEIQPIDETQLQQVGVILGPSNDPDPTFTNEVSRPTESPKIHGPTSSNTMIFKAGPIPKVLKTQKNCKWKRAARAKVGHTVISDLGKFSQLGKRLLGEGEEDGQLTAKKIRNSSRSEVEQPGSFTDSELGQGRDYEDGTASEVVQSSAMQPGSVTSTEVLDQTENTQAVLGKLAASGRRLDAWNATKRRKHRQDINHCRKELKHVSLVEKPNDWKTIRSLEDNLDEALAVEETYWRQRAKADWMKKGDLDVLNQIAKTMGATNWTFGSDACEGTYDVKPVVQTDPLRNITCDCEIENDTCHVTVIKFMRYSLPGTLPPELVHLPYISEISVFVNRLSGNIPSHLGKITSLTYLDLEENQFSGMVPPDLGKLVNLETLKLSSNRFSGNLPLELAELKNLTDFRINDNNFTGSIPEFISSWNGLSRLEIQGSGLKGPIPSSLSILEKLTQMSVKISLLLE